MVRKWYPVIDDLMYEVQLVEESGCSCGYETTSEKKIVVEYIYLDLETCDRCIGTDNVLGEVMMTLTPALNIAGFEVKYDKIEMKTAEIATQYKFLSSPTIRVNGQDWNVFRPCAKAFFQ